MRSVPDRCLVTGSGGFLGKYLVEALINQGAEVIRHTRSTVVESKGAVSFDLGQAAINPKGLGKVDVVYHLANIAHVNLAKSSEHLYQQVNVEGTQKLLQLALELGASKFIYVSSTKAGLSDHLRHNDPYARSKLEAENVVLEFGRQHGIHVAIVRPSLIYGVGVKGNLDRMLRAIIKRRYPPLPDFGNQRSMVSANDTVVALIMCAKNPLAKGKVYTLADKVKYNPRNIYKQALIVLGRSPGAITIPKPVLMSLARLGDLLEAFFGGAIGFNTKTLQKLSSSELYTSSLIQTELGWVPQETLYDLLPGMIQYIEKLNSRTKARW